MCPHCQASAKFVDRRAKSFVGLLGELRLKRCYYRCRCGYSEFPWDRTLRLDTAARLTPAAQEVTCIVAAKASFAESSERTLHKVCGLRLSESTISRRFRVLVASRRRSTSRRFLYEMPTSLPAARMS